MSVVTLLSTTHYVAYKNGFKKADAQWVARIDEEQQRQQEANNEAAKKSAETIRQLRLSKEVRDATILRLRGEAAKDINAGNVSIGLGSVRRLNSIVE